MDHHAAMTTRQRGETDEWIHDIDEEHSDEDSDDDNTRHAPRHKRKRNLVDVDNETGDSRKRKVPHKQEFVEIKKLVTEISLLCPPPPEDPWNFPRLSLSDAFVFKEWPQTERRKRSKADPALSDNVKDALNKSWLEREVCSTGQDAYRAVLSSFGLSEDNVRRIFKQRQQEGYFQKLAYLVDQPAPQHLKPHERSAPARYNKALKIWLLVCQQRVEYFFKAVYKKAIQEGVELKNKRKPELGFNILQGYEWIRPSHCVGGKILDFEQFKEKDAISAARLQSHISSSWVYMKPQEKVELFEEMFRLVLDKPQKLPPSQAMDVRSLWKESVLHRLRKEEQSRRDELLEALQKQSIETRIQDPDFERAIHPILVDELNTLFERRPEQTAIADGHDLRLRQTKALHQYQARFDVEQKTTAKGFLKTLTTYCDDLEAAIGVPDGPAMSNSSILSNFEAEEPLQPFEDSEDIDNVSGAWYEASSNVGDECELTVDHE